MPDLTQSQIIFLVTVVLFTAVAAMTDLRTRKIPNKLTVPMCLAGLLFQLSFHHFDGARTAMLGFAAGFGVMVVLWMVGTAGGGDVKLMGALGPWLGAVLTLKVLFVSLMFVAVGSVGIVFFAILSKGISRARAQYLKSGTKSETSGQRQKRRVMPFAVPVALATWCLLALELFRNQGS